MSNMRVYPVTLAGLISFLFAWGCGSDGGEQPATGGQGGGAAAAGMGGSGGASGTGGSSGSGGSAVDGGCTPSGGEDLPDEDFLDSDCDGIDGNAASAVFVSPDGFDDAPGTLDDPVQSVLRGIELATEGGRAVYVCNGTYRENLRVTAPVSVHGGYDCSLGWRRTKDWAVIEPGVGVPLVIQAVSGKVHMERMAFRALDAVAAGQSAQAAGVVDSSDVTFARVEFLSGNGANGANGIPGRHGSPTPVVSMPTGASGQPTQADCAADASTLYCDRYSAGGFAQAASRTCQDSTGKPWVGRGGAGGRGGNARLAPNANCNNAICDPGVTGSPGQYHEGDAQWKDVAATNLGQNGSNGQDGAGATRGIGSIENALYLASNSGDEGTDAAPGFPGRGGNGKLSCYHRIGDFCLGDFYPGSGGGQGGVGGCGGWHANGAAGGGGSIGIVVVNSTVTIEFSRFAVGDGGRGGNGARGGDGEPGGPPGLGGSGANSASYTGDNGQPGGDGGQGGDGGPAGGGPSIAVLYSGSSPEISDAVYQIGLPGAGGTAVSGANGATGVTAEVLNIDEAP
jgi:hypothetical protein